VSSESVGLWDKTVRFLQRDLWHPEATARAGRRALRRTLQFSVIVWEGFVDDLVLLRASALTYYSVLALIPLLAITVAVLGALGVGENVAHILVERLAGAVSPEGGQRILELVQQVRFGALGTVGAAVLFATSVLGIGSIERSLNTVWGVDRERPWDRRFADYLAVLIVAPLLLGVAVSVGTTLQSDALVQRLLEIPGFETVYRFGLAQAPVVVLCLGFSFLYWFLPNTRVRLVSAVFGGIVGALLFTLAQSGYIRFSVGVARANVVFGSIYFLPILFVWIYVSWVIVLFGAEVACAHQNFAALRRARRGDEPRPAAREAIGVAIAARMARAFRSGAAIDADGLAAELGTSLRSVRGIVADLERAGIAATRGEDKLDTYQLGRAADRILVVDVLEAMRGARETVPADSARQEPVAELLARMDGEAAKALQDVTLADLAETLASVAESGEGSA
jgi:membrane protein